MSPRQRWITLSVLPLLCAASVIQAHAQATTFRPYIQPGDNGPFGAKDQMVVAWQTNEASPSQIDHMSNYSFDHGNAHFVFLDANPHLFGNLLPSGPPATPPAFPFPPYPSVLRDWLINDLDSSGQTWKVVVFHQPIFSSGNATISNDQMRTIGAFLQDHGVNLVFNGQEHNGSYSGTPPGLCKEAPRGGWCPSVWNGAASGR